MKLLFVNQFYLPDAAATAQILGDVVPGAAGKVGVVCGRVGYTRPWAFANSFGPQVGGQARAQVGEEAPGGNPAAGQKACPTVRRVGGVGFGHGYLRKLMSYGGFYLGAFWAVMAGERAEVVVTMTTPPLLGLIGWAAQGMRGSRHVIWEMDVYPDVAVGLGTFRRGGVLERVVGWMADLPRRKADGVIVLGRCMAELMERRGVSKEKIWICENWADGEEIGAGRFHEGVELRVLYSGNLGLAHDVETLIGAIDRLGEGFRFRFCGGGPRRREMEAGCAGKSWVEFEGYEERGRLGARLGWGDVGLVTQRGETVGTVVPSKAYGVMAAGRGVLYVGPGESEVGRMVEEEGVGWRVGNGDVPGLVGVLERLRGDRGEVERVGRRAREVFERKYERRIGVKRVVEAIERCTR